MRIRRGLEGFARAAARRPVVALGIVVSLAVAGALLSLGLRPNAADDTFVSRSSASFHATENEYAHFGGDPVVILIREPLPDLVETADLGRLSELEACLAGQVLIPSEQLEAFAPAPPGSQPPYGGYRSPCGKLMRAKAVQVVYGPGTFLNEAVGAVNKGIQAMLTSARRDVASAERDAYQLAVGRGMGSKQAQVEAKAAGELEAEQQVQQLEQLALQTGISPLQMPGIDNEQFISQIVFDQTRGVNQPKARFAYLFPTADSALIQVRLKPSLSYAQQSTVISWIRQAVRLPMFRLGSGGTYTVTGEPVVLNDLASAITSSIARLLVAALVVMATMLLLVFRSRLRLLPLAIALAATAITFGATSLLGGSLTMASIAVLPILIGLAVDYAIQFQSRVQEARRVRDHIGDGSEAAAEAVADAASVGAPTIATAALATATGFLVLLLSPVPMVRGFGLLLVLGIAVALACALSAGSAAIVQLERDGGVAGAWLRGAADILRPGLRFAADTTRASLAGAVEIVRGAARRLRATRPRHERRRRRRDAGSPMLAAGGRRSLAVALKRPGTVLAVGVVLAGLGWIADTQTSVQSDVTKLVPASMPALRDLHALERLTGVSGEIDVTVRGRDVATPQTITWMKQYEQGLLDHYGYLETEGCARATLCPALSLPDLFSGSSGKLTRSSITSLLASIPAYFSQAVITNDRREASLAFGIRLMPLSRQQRVVDYMRSQLHPPPGARAQLAGLPVLAAEANAALSSSGRRLLTLVAGLVAVALVLLAVLRERRRAIVPLIPIVLATGWSALVLFAIRIPLNPMSATLGALVIAISTEFSVLLSERFRQERRAGHELTDALARTYRFTGAAVLASGVTAIGGFGVLVFSSITMLRDFGFVTLIDLSVSLGGVLLVLPSVLVLAERGELVDGVRDRIRRAADVIPRPRRRARVA